MFEDTHPSTHPPLPPTTEDDRISWLRLLRSRRVGPSTFHRLMQEHGNAQVALEALPEVARNAGVNTYVPCTLEAAEMEYAAGMRAGARLICWGETDYPVALSQLTDAPPLLWAKGEPGLLQKRRVAIVGARNASSLGLRMARALAHELTKDGFVVVSGLARGVDTAAHKAALDGGTIAVMAGGIDVIYPAENTHLGQDIAARGLCISEQPIGQTPQARHFPTRNRIISGISEAVVVVEAAAKSGSLITARTALDQGREVLAVPGHPFDARASGCNMLIRDGARLVRTGTDVAEALQEQQDLALKSQTGAQTAHSNAQPPPQPNKARQPPDALRRLILDHLSPSPLAEDQLIRDLASSAAQMTPALTDLEMSGRIIRHPGGLVSLAH